MKLEGIPVQLESYDYFDFWQASTKTQQIDLHLTINFSEQWEPLHEGRVKFGLKGGQLNVKLVNMEIPYESLVLAGSLELSFHQKRQYSQGSNDQKSIQVGAQATNSSSDGSETRDCTSFGLYQSSGRTDQFPDSVCHVTTKVSEESPAWIFEEKMGEPVLKGFLEKARLATLKVLALPCRLEATFEVSKRDVCLTDAEGLWPPDISPNKRAVLARLIIQRLLEPKFKPYISRAELHYD
jgi:hypothetical protein